MCNDRWRRVEQHDAIARRQDATVDTVVIHTVALDAADVVPLLVESGTERDFGIGA